MSEQVQTTNTYISPALRAIVIPDFPYIVPTRASSYSQEVRYPANELTDSDITNVLDEMERLYFPYYPRAIFHQFDWSPDNANGRITKRIEKHVKDTTGVKLNDRQLSVIGEFIARRLSDMMTRYVSITNQFDWQDGQFGDEGSCYWGCYSQTRDALENSGYAFALRFHYALDTKLSGLGRCWGVGLPDYRGIVLYNAYGARLEHFARVFTEITGIPGVACKLRDYRGEYADNFYINGGKGVYFPMETRQPITIVKDTCVRIDEQLTRAAYDNDDDDEEYVTCDICGEEIPESDSCNTHDATLCEICYENTYYCAHCDVFHDNDTTHYDDGRRAFCLESLQDSDNDAYGVLDNGDIYIIYDDDNDRVYRRFLLRRLIEYMEGRNITRLYYMTFIADILPYARVAWNEMSQAE